MTDWEEISAASGSLAPFIKHWEKAMESQQVVDSLELLVLSSKVKAWLGH